MSDMKAGASPARAEAERIAAVNGGSLGMSREAAAEYLKARGIEPRPGSTLADYKPAPAPKPDDYRFDLVGTHLPSDADTAAVLAGGRNLSAALGLPEHLASMVTRSMAESPDPDPAATEAWLSRAGHDYKALTAKVDAAIAKAGSEFAKVVKAADLPAHVLVQLGNWADHVAAAKR